MNRLSSILPASHVLVSVDSTSKKRAFEQVSATLIADLASTRCTERRDAWLASLRSAARIKPIVLLKAIVPGGSRLGIFISGALIVVGLAFIAALVTGIALLILVLDSLFATTKDWPPVGIFLVVDIVLLASAIGSVVLFTRSRKSARRAGERAGKALAARPATALAVSIALPPPMPITKSQPAARAWAAPASTVPMVGSPAAAMLAMPMQRREAGAQ